MIRTLIRGMRNVITAYINKKI